MHKDMEIRLQKAKVTGFGVRTDLGGWEAGGGRSVTVKCMSSHADSLSLNFLTYKI